MPIYEYQCKACGHHLETLQKISDAPLTLCPVCQENELTKLVSAAGFRLKGSGWYETDFKSGQKKNLVGEGSTKSSDTKASSSPSDKKGSDAAGSKNKST